MTRLNDLPSLSAGVALDAVSPRQSNYHAYRLPDGVVMPPGAPLYHAVALWGWTLGRPFCRPEVADAFGITLQRAGDVMSYIRRARPDVVTSRQFYAQLAGGVRQRFIQILAEPRIDGGRRETSGRRRRAEAATPQCGREVVKTLRQWFLTRPNPG